MANFPHIFLCGFMGSGKSTLGKKTASLLKRTYFDLDDYIEKKVGKTIPDIFKESGESGFREFESKYLHEIIQLTDASLIALGGGTVCFNNNLGLIKQSGLLVYLKLPESTLAQRIIESKKTRPILTDLGHDDLLNNIRVMMINRKQYYEQAQLIVSGINLSPQILIHEINRVA